MTAEEAASKPSPKLGGVQVGDALSRLQSGSRPGLSAASCGSVHLYFFVDLRW